MNKELTTNEHIILTDVKNANNNGYAFGLYLLLGMPTTKDHFALKCLLRKGKVRFVQNEGYYLA